MFKETDFHLFQPPLYRSTDGVWRESFMDSAEAASSLTLDATSIASILSLSYTSADRTLFKEIQRKPWLSRIVKGQIELLEVPPHGRCMPSYLSAARELFKLLTEEARNACEGKKEIYILQSGGLDSRIVGVVMARVHKEGGLSAKPVCVTWGLENSRDVVYGRLTAQRLGFDWKHIPVGPSEMIFNTQYSSNYIGALVSPPHFHCLQWFRTVSRDALVLAGSYGDSVGRAEFSGRHVLELDHLRIFNRRNLLNPGVFVAAQRSFRLDMESLHHRAIGQPKYVLCEHERHAVYMRNMLAHVMSVVNRYAAIYQMFTAPKVYGYIWSLHPSMRTDYIYAYLLEAIDPSLARLPWARTNSALIGPTEGVVPGLRCDYHEYVHWIATDVRDCFKHLFEPEWFAETKLFSLKSVMDLDEDLNRLRKSKTARGFLIAEKWMNLIAFRILVTALNKNIGCDDESLKPLAGDIPKRLIYVSISEVKGFLDRKKYSSSLITKIANSIWNAFRIVNKKRLFTIAKKKLPPIY